MYMQEVNKMKLMMIDLDGTLFDTKEINYRAYKEAIGAYGYNIDYKYYCEFCNGRHYTDFLPQITTTHESLLLDIHKRKKEAYSKYLKYGRVNQALVDLIRNRGWCKAALVTTASKQNTYDILNEFGITGIFDLILTHEDITKSKPDPEGFLKAMAKYNVKPEECIIFEDSGVGIEAAGRTGATVFVAKGFN